MRTKLTWPKLIVLSVAGLLSLAWLAVNLKDFISTQNGLIRLILGTAFSILIIVRPKAETDDKKTILGKVCE